MAAVPAFATAQQMEQRSNGAIPATRPFVDDMLRAATQLIRNYCGWHIAEVVAESVFADGLAGRFLYLPTAHLVTVDSVTIDGTTLELATDTLQWSQDGTLWRDRWTVNYRAIEVQITHGYTTTPIDITDLCCQIAGRAIVSPTGVVREQTLSSSVTYSQAGFNQAGGLVLLDSEKDALAEYRVGIIP